MDEEADRRAITALNDDFCHELDRGTVAGLVALFMPDAVYSREERVSSGQAEIRALFEARTAGGPRTSRHLTSGLRIAFTGSDQAVGLSICTVYTAAGMPPVSGTLPGAVADFEDVYMRTEDGWRFARRHIRTIFQTGS
jgi:ketosteroid isomerase-like protein